MAIKYRTKSQVLSFMDGKPRRYQCSADNIYLNIVDIKGIPTVGIEGLTKDGNLYVSNGLTGTVVVHLTDMKPLEVSVLKVEGGTLEVEQTATGFTFTGTEGAVATVQLSESTYIYVKIEAAADDVEP